MTARRETKSDGGEIPRRGTKSDGGEIPRRRGKIAMGLAVVLFVAVNVLLDAVPASWSLDVTAARRHTLTEATHRTLANIPEPLDLRLYISPEIRQSRGRRGAHAERVEALLRRYARLADGGIRLKVLRPEPFSETEDQALADGLRPLNLGGARGTGYFGLAGINSTDDRETLPTFAPARAGLLEADLTRLIHALAHPRKPKVGLLGRLDLMTPGESGESPTPNRLRAVMNQHVTPQPVARDAERLPPDLDALVLLHPTGLAPTLRKAIADFVQDGGQVLAFVDPLSEHLRYRPTPAEGARPDAAVHSLLASWGLHLTEDRFVGDRGHAMTVRARVGGRDGEVPYVGWLDLPRDTLARGHPVTAGLTRLVLKSAGALTPAPGAEDRFTPLATSGPDAALLPVDRIAGGPEPARLLADFPTTGDTTRHVLAAEVRPGTQGGRAIVVADSDMLHDSAWLRRTGEGDPAAADVPVADNGAFALAALEALTEGASLAGLRGGAPPDRPFTRIERLRTAAEQRYRTRETRLIDTVGEARQELRTLQRKQRARGSAPTAPTAEEADRMASLRETLREARRDLRDVQYKLRADVARLQRRVQLANVWGVPAVIALVAGGLALIGRRMRDRRARRWLAEETAPQRRRQATP